MRQIIVGIIIVGIIGALGFAFITGQHPKPTALPEGAVIYDVRTQDEYTTSHITSAKLLPVEDIQKGTLPSEPKTTPIALYCHSGRRASIAADILKKAGYTNVINIGAMQEAASQYGLAIAT